MTNVEQDLLTTLLDLEETIRVMRTAERKPNILPLFDRLDQLTQRLPKDTDPALLHYLHKKSYEKARLWLQGRDADNQRGNCGHVD